MKANLKDKGKCGIYCIRNLINGKVYIGKSIDIHRRIKRHVGYLNQQSSKHENQHLINAWLKYGRNNFEYFVLEYLDLDEILLKNREMYWILQFDSINRIKGYNLRMDSDTKMICSDETKLKIKESLKKRFSKQSERDKASEFFKVFWQENPDKLESMRSKIKDKNHKYTIQQFDKQHNFIKEWNSVEDIIKENPTYKWQNIYSVCNGYKPTIYGYIWKKNLRYSPILNES